MEAPSMRFKRIIPVCFVMALMLQQVTGQVYERKRSEQKAFRVFDETSLEIENKYGNIHLFPWEKDSVMIRVEINVKANKEQKADKIFDYIDIEVSSTKYYIVAKTNFRQSEGSLWTELSDLASALFNSGNKAQVDYFVYLPGEIELKISNKFGNIYTTDHNGKTDIELSNGDLKANDLTGALKIDLNFGNADIHSVRAAEIKAGYSEMHIGNAAGLIIESKSSEVHIGKADVIKLESRRDKYFINEASEINMKSSFSYITSELLTSRFESTTDYGEVNIKLPETDFEKIQITSRYTDISIGTNAGSGCDLVINHSKNTALDLPSDMKGPGTEQVSDREDKYITRGRIGAESETRGKIDISIINGKVKINR